jgi:hypothetical protein
MGEFNVNSRKGALPPRPECRGIRVQNSMNNVMVATAMLAAAEAKYHTGQTDPRKIVGALGHGAEMVLTTDASGKRTLTFNGHTEAVAIIPVASTK